MAIRYELKTGIAEVLLAAKKRVEDAGWPSQSTATSRARRVKAPSGSASTGEPAQTSSPSPADTAEPSQGGTGSTPRTRAPNGTFDKKAYMKLYMRQYRLSRKLKPRARADELEAMAKEIEG
jgi:hypothetical protein